MTHDLAPLAESLPDGVLHMELPTPFPVGPVNCWLLPAEPVTLIDPGMVWADSVQLVEQLLSEAGLHLGDVGRIIVTHGHPDHFGLAGRLARQSGAPILCGREERRKLLSAYDAPRFQHLLVSLGVPEEVRVSFPDAYAAMRGLIDTPDSAAIEVVDDGDTLQLGGRSFEAHVTPGHATGHLSLFDGAAGALFSGDHLLPRITPNPVLEPDVSSGGRRHSLVEYLDFLERFVDLDPAVVLPGHGPAFHDVPMLVATMRRHHERRAGEVLELVRSLGAPTGYELSTAMFRNLEGFGVMLGVSEAVGHIDLLINDGLVVASDRDDDVVRYSPA